MLDHRKPAIAAGFFIRVVCDVVKINFFENEAEIRQSQVDPNFDHALHKLAEVQTAAEILVEATVRLAEPAELLKDTVVDVLKQLIHTVILLFTLKHGLAIQTLHEVL